MSINGYRAMWVVTMFDLPTDTKAARRAYSNFRHRLLDEGFLMLQYSVYARPCLSDEVAEGVEKRIKSELPSDGEVRIMSFTDKQYARMKFFHGKTRKATEKLPEQLSIF